MEFIIVGTNYMYPESKGEGLLKRYPSLNNYSVRLSGELIIHLDDLEHLVTLKEDLKQDIVLLSVRRAGYQVLEIYDDWRE